MICTVKSNLVIYFKKDLKVYSPVISYSGEIKRFDRVIELFVLKFVFFNYCCYCGFNKLKYTLLSCSVSCHNKAQKTFTKMKIT